MEYHTAVDKFFNTEKLFQAACKKVILLDQRLSRLDVQSKRAHDGGLRSCQLSRKIQISTLEGVRFAYYEYASRKAEEMDELRRFCLAEEPMED